MAPDFTHKRLTGMFMLLASLAIAYGQFKSLLPLAYGALVHNRPIDAGDIELILAATRMMFTTGESPYSLAAYKQLVETIAGIPGAFPYPPISCVLFLPLAVLPPYAGIGAMTLANFVAFAAIVVLLWHLCLKDFSNKTMILLGAAMLAGNDYVAILINEGNPLLLTLAFVLASALIDRRGGPSWLIGLLLALAGLTKFYTFGLFGLYLLWRRWGVLAAGAAATALAAIVSILVFPPQMWLEWLQNVAQSGSYGKDLFDSYAAAMNINSGFNGTLSRLLGVSALSRGIIVVCSLAVLVVSAVAMAKRMKGDPWNAYALALAAMFLAVPFAWTTYLMFVLPATLILLQAADDARGSAAQKAVAFVLAALWLMPWVFLVHSKPAPLVLVMPGLIGLAAWLALLLLSFRPTRA